MKKTPLKKVSKKRQRELKTYSMLRDAFLEAHPMCEFPTMSLPCRNRASDVHHMSGRNGARLNETWNWKSLCRRHHQEIHDNPAYARSIGLLK